jgi:diguanylate cyclase (GGDEF)-like protein
MNLRLRLVLALVTIALVVVMIFGGVAHRIAQEAGTQQELQLLGRAAHRLGDRLGGLLREGMPPRSALDALTAYGESHWQLQLQHPAGALLSAGAKFPRASALPHLGRSRRAATGTLAQGSPPLIWATAAVGATSYRLRVLTPDQVTRTAGLPSLASRLFWTGVGVVALALAGALGLTELMARRLDEHNEALTHRALHDSLTGLPNRTLLLDRLGQCLADAHRHGYPVALFVMDLDRFKEVNDTLGHRSGDELLQTVGGRVRGVLRRSDTIARLGGDEFAILLPHTSPGRAVRCAEKIIDALETPIPTAGVQLDVDISIGISTFPDHGTDAQTLIQHADVAMYQAKQANLGYAVYEPREDHHSVRRLTLMAELRSAIEQHQLRLHYQPKVDLRSRRIIGVEALVRWHHSKYGQVPPDEFIPLTEQSGLIFPLTHWVLAEALRQCDQWARRGIRLQVAVNLSTCSLQDAHCAQRIAELFTPLSIGPEQLVLEITESAMMADVNRAMDVVTALDAIGVRLAIDDFGTGFSSLSHLKRLPVDEIKIDRSFVQNMDGDEGDAIIVRSIVDLAHNMGCSVVAEGVERESTLQLLDRLGCETVQGYFLGHPQPPELLEQWLVSSPWGLPQLQAETDEPPLLHRA